MKLIRQYNSYTCFLASMAMILDESMEQLIQELGHDGSEEIEPGIYRAFHYQEFIDLAIKRGYAVTVIEFSPRSENYKTGKVWDVIPEEKCMERFRNHLLGNKGIICGLRGDYHAVAWDGKIYDPGKGVITDLAHIDMQLDYLLRIDKIISK